MVAASVPGHALADTVPACSYWTADITSISATGPGTASVVGRVTTARSDGNCAHDAQLAGYTIERTGPRSWNLGEVTGTAPLPSTWRSGDQFTQQISLAAGTNAVCVRTASARGVSCDGVYVGAEKDGSPTTPVVGGQIYPPSRQGDGSVDVCGNCV